MKSSELFQRILAGEFFLVGEYRGGSVVENAHVDRKTGNAFRRLLVYYMVECTVAGRFVCAKVIAQVPGEIVEASQVVLSLSRGRRYAFPVQSINYERDMITAWLGKIEPLPIEDE